MWLVLYVHALLCCASQHFQQLLAGHAPSFDLGGTPYVFTMLRDVEFLENVERKLDLGFETAKRNPLLLPHAPASCTPQPQPPRQQRP